MRSLKGLHRQNEVVQEASACSGFWFSGIRRPLGRRNEPSVFMIDETGFLCFSFLLDTIRVQVVLNQIQTEFAFGFAVCVSQIHFYNEEFDPGSG